MRKNTAKTGAALLFALASAGSAQEPTPQAVYEEQFGRPKRAPIIPEAVRTMVAEATPDRLVVRRIDGSTVSRNLDYIDLSDFATYQDGRYLGYVYSGHEADGYDLIDRRSDGDPFIETGVRPAFSPDGRWFASAEMSEAAFGNLNGIAVWEVLPDRTVRRFFTDALPRSLDWRVDGWVRRDCLALSSLETEWEPPAGLDWEQALRSAPRVRYTLTVGDEIVLTPSYDRPPCSEEPAP